MSVLRIDVAAHGSCCRAARNSDLTASFLPRRQIRTAHARPLTELPYRRRHREAVGYRLSAGRACGGQVWAWDAPPSAECAAWSSVCNQEKAVLAGADELLTVYR